jgi:predicted metal-dependent enzyme (double-stranded beta helix superfamily)
MLQRSLYHAEVPPGPLRRRARVALESLDPTAEGVQRFVTAFPLPVAEAAPVIAFSKAERVRVLLARSDDAEMFLCAWLPGQASSVHDHGDASHAVRVLAGVLAEDVYETPDGESARLREVRTLGPGTVTHHLDRVVHRLRNASPHLAVTLHVRAAGRERPQRYVTNASDTLPAPGGKA